MADDLVAVGGDLSPATLHAAYTAGLFPMGLGEHGAPPLGWFSPVRRGVLLPGAFHESGSLRRAWRRFTITVDRDFAGVVAACADPSREGAWITPAVAAAYTQLHRLGVAHSVEVWAGGRLVGGLYGVGYGGFFAGESMFHHASNASKVAVGAMAAIVVPPDSSRLVDVQWSTPHLASLGVVDVSRRRYAALLTQALAAPPPRWTWPPRG